MSQELGIEAARARLGDLANEVQSTGTDITLTRNGKPVARLAPHVPGADAERPPAVRAFMDCTGKSSINLLHNRHGAKGKLGGSINLAISGSAPQPETVPQLPGKATTGIHQAALILPEDSALLDILARELREAADLLTQLAEAKRLRPEETAAELWSGMARAAELKAQQQDADA